MSEHLQQYRLERMRGKHQFSRDDYRDFNDVQAKLEKVLATIESSMTHMYWRS